MQDLDCCERCGHYWDRQCNNEDSIYYCENTDDTFVCGNYETKWQFNRQYENENNDW